MANNIITHMIFVMFFLLTSFCVNNVAQLLLESSTTPRGVFIFGDSTSDVGTNNYIASSNVKSNHVYYGIDYKNHMATGRWSNGENMIDHLCQLMGFETSPPPYLAHHSRFDNLNEIISRGYNFASGGSGLFNSTHYEIEGAEELPLVPVLEQIDQFLKIRDYLIEKWGEKAAMDYLTKSVYIMSIGNNDIIKSTTSYPGSRILDFWETEFPRYMSAYRHSIMVLYRDGARKFGFVSPLPIGCMPYIRSKVQPNATCSDPIICVEEPNIVSNHFHHNLTRLLKNIKSKHGDITYSIGNTFHIFKNIMNTKFSACACCGSGTLNAVEFCDKNTPNFCPYRDEYTFWDGVHPTDDVAKILAQELFTGGKGITTPISFAQMVAGKNTPSV